MKKVLISILFLLLVLPATVCAKDKIKAIVELKTYPLDSMKGVISKIQNIEIDEEISSDGKASLKIKATEPISVNLYKTGDLNVENAELVYQAKIKTENFKGKAFLEMWCNFQGKGRYFSRDLVSPVTGDTKGWVQEETPFYLKKGENPDDVELNVVINGTGTVWIDDVKLIKKPLRK
ncbi:MAG: hypothetical protein AB1782_16005 [Cyanobacteriota bacterium]